jgi:hypothetical protein
LQAVTFERGGIKAMFTPENIYGLIGHRFKASFDDRPLYLYYSKLYNTWSIYLAIENMPLHTSYKDISAEHVCEFLNSKNYTIKILSGYYG